MRFQKPSLPFLLHVGEALKKGYKGYNNKRLSFIRLYKRLTRFTANEENELRRSILFSILIFGLVSIENEYYYTSPNRSTLYQLITKFLSISPINTLSNEERLIHLVYFYHFIMNNMDKEMVFDLCWQDKLTLIDAIKKNMIYLLHHDIKKNIKDLLAELPIASALKKGIKTLINDYKSVLDSRWLPSTSRRTLLNFLIDINESCDHYSLAMHPQMSSLNEDFVKRVRLALLLFVLLKINNDHYFFSCKPTKLFGNTLCGSELFEKTLNTIHIKDLNQLDTATKISWLRTLSMYIKNLKESNADFAKWQIFEEEIDHFLMEQEIELNKPSRSQEYLNMLIGYAARYGMTFAATRLVACTAIPSIETALIGSISGPVGMVIYSAAGTIIASPLVELINNKIIPAALVGVYTQILAKIGNAIGYTASTFITITFEVSRQGLNNLLHFYSDVQHENGIQEDEEWIMALLNLPDDVFSREDKNIIQYLRDIPDEKIETIGLLLEKTI